VQDDGAGFEELDFVVAVCGDLAEGLTVAIGGGGLGWGIDQDGFAGEAGFLQRPAHAEVAHERAAPQRNALT
jgi:hypothetical protein